jgi:hypothetical protein
MMEIVAWFVFLSVSAASIRMGWALGCWLSRVWDDRLADFVRIREGQAAIIFHEDGTIDAVRLAGDLPKSASLSIYVATRREHLALHRLLRLSEGGGS